MDSLWPWLVVAAAGALHGLNPASGWPLAAAWGLRGEDRLRAWRALPPIALGHLVSIGLVAGAVLANASIDRTWSQAAGATLLLGVVWHHLTRQGRTRTRPPTGHAGLALWSFIVSTGHGAGVMLVPALIPLCAPGLPGREADAAGTLWVALMAVGVHTAAMLLACGVAANVAAGVLRIGRHRGRPGSGDHSAQALDGASESIEQAGQVGAHATPNTSSDWPCSARSSSAGSTAWASVRPPLRG